MDGRRRDAKRLKATIDELVEHVGGRPTAAELRIIYRTAFKELKLSRFDEMDVLSDGLSERQRREYVWIENSYRRDLQALGLEARGTEPKSLAEHLAGKAA